MIKFARARGAMVPLGLVAANLACFDRQVDPTTKCEVVDVDQNWLNAGLDGYHQPPRQMSALR